MLTLESQLYNEGGSNSIDIIILMFHVKPLGGSKYLQMNNIQIKYYNNEVKRKWIVSRETIHFPTL